MSTLYVDFGYDDNIIRELNSLSSKLDSRSEDYRGIRNKIANVGSNTQNLYQANTYLDRKRNKLEEKTEKLSRFKSAVSSFDDYARSADKRVANEIKDSRKDFCKSKGLADGFLYTVGVALSTGFNWLKQKVVELVEKTSNMFKSAWQWVQEFYEKNKYIIDVIVDGIVLVAAVAALVAAIVTGNLPLIAASLWGLAKAFFKFEFSYMANDAYKNGEDKYAEWLSGKGLKEILKWQYGETAGSIIYHGLNIASFVLSFSCTLKDISYLKTIDGVDKYQQVLSQESITGIHSYGKRLSVKIITKFDTTKLSLKTVTGNAKVIASGLRGFASKGMAGIFGIGILKDFSELSKDITSLICPELAEALPY